MDSSQNNQAYSQDSTTGGIKAIDSGDGDLFSTKKENNGTSNGGGSTHSSYEFGGGQSQNGEETGTAGSQQQSETSQRNRENNVLDKVDDENENSDNASNLRDFCSAAKFYERPKYPSRKRPSTGGGDSDNDDDNAIAFDKVTARKLAAAAREDSGDDDYSLGNMKKVRAAVYRNATGSTCRLNAVYGKLKGSLMTGGGRLSSPAAYRPVIDANRSPSPGFAEESGEREEEHEDAENGTNRNRSSSSSKNKSTTPKYTGTAAAAPKRSSSSSSSTNAQGKAKQPIAYSGGDRETERLVDIIETEILDAGAINVTWDDVAGLAPIKKTIQEIVVWPMLRPELFTGLRAPPKGLLLFGPPGTGKTTLGRCIASQAKATFYCISASSLTSKWVGENEKLVRALFESARSHQPAVIFVDEVDALLANRVEGEHDSTRRLKTQFLTELDGAKTSADDRVLVVGATNRPGDLDDAARRRFTKRLYVPLPDHEGRTEMVRCLLKNESHSLTEETMQLIADRTEGFSCDDLKKMCHEAALGPIRRIMDISSASSEQLPPISVDDFEKALRMVRPSVAKEQLAQYEDFDRRFGSASAMHM